MIGGMMNGMGFGSYGLIGAILNLVITVGLIVGIVLLVVWAVRKTSQGNGTRWGGASMASEMSSPREIVRTRYARGELTREQYQELLKDLG